MHTHTQKKKRKKKKKKKKERKKSSLYLFTQTLPPGQDTTQGQFFLRGIKLNSEFYFSKTDDLTKRKKKNLVWPTIHL